jgi:glycosidase
MVGPAPFYDGFTYCPYQTIPDLIADLDRIAELGFQCLQLMPRHPYPSYNIHEPGDVALTYGEPQELQALVAECHSRGIRLIFDILLHGVIDKEVMQRAVGLVQNGPHAGRLDDPCSDPYDHESVEISWCRHILAFAPYWLEGAPDHHPLLDAHPEWFMRDSHGNITGVYTHALDIANQAWQDRFIEGCETMVRQYGIDGFRLDAPLYNRFPNWSETTRRHASYSSMGALRLFRRLRRRLHAISTDIILHTEPSGPFAREAIDLNYGYEEMWLIPSLFDRRQNGKHDWRRVKTGHELAEWFANFDAALPAGSVSAHFVDCHDTIWWRLHGDLWRREQIGLAATKAVLPIYALRGGAFMMFVGGEEGLEAELQRVHALRKHLPEIRDGAVDYDEVSVDAEAIYCVLRRSAHRAALLAVNTSDAPTRATCTVRATPLESRTERDSVLDAWNDELLPHGSALDDGRVEFHLTFAPYQARLLLLSGLPSKFPDLPRLGRR